MENMTVGKTDHLTIDAKRENLSQVLSFVDGILENEDCNMKAMMQIDVAVEEIFINIASYAYTDSVGEAGIHVTVMEDPKAVEIEFRDSGIPFDPLAKPDPDTTLPAEERQIGGLGIYMVKKSMDKVSYEYTEGQNILKIVKSI